MEANDTNREPPQIVPLASDVPLWFPDLRSGIFDEKRRRRPIPIKNKYYSLLLLWSWRWLLLLLRQPAVARIVPRYLTSKYYKIIQMLHGKNWWSRDWRVAWRVSGVSMLRVRVWARVGIATLSVAASTRRHRMDRRSNKRECRPRSVIQQGTYCGNAIPKGVSPRCHPAVCGSRPTLLDYANKKTARPFLV